MRMHKKLFLIIAVLLLAGCGQKDLSKEVEQMGELKLTSPAFENNKEIPSKYTCDGSDISPPLEIGGIPAEAKSLVLIVDDPDAPMGTWDHWILWNIPLVANIDENSVPGGAVQGTNDFKKLDYGGPCPPSGTHRYMFKLYALDAILDLAEGANKDDVEKAMEGHIIAQTKLIGLYKRK
jgi:Raf kinase inhibitor-like YbhB/YbcL family protein